MTNEQELSIGQSMHDRLKSLYPICRSITGKGVRETLTQLQSVVPIVINEVPSGMRVFDWTIPLEWNIRGAWIRDACGNVVVDFKNHNLHVMSYSVPIQATMSLDALKQHLHFLPNQPDAIPYRTSYYQEDWGFCISHRTLASLAEGEYEVCIDSELAPGNLSYGELFLPGELEDEILISSHVCHPSLANDNLSGIVVATELARSVAAMATRRYSYRFLFMPGTIGAIAWLALNEHNAFRIKHGLILSGVGDAGNIHYKRSRMGDATIDRVVGHVLRNRDQPHAIHDFSPYGYDERQFCSPGFNLPVGCFSRSVYGTYPEYHTSLDNPEFVKPASLYDSLDVLRQVVHVLEENRRFLNTNPKCEPQLGKRGLYQRLESNADALGMFWILNSSDGKSSLLDIAERAGIPFGKISKIAKTLADCELIQEIPSW
ncbi:MAG: DUF4910 domain-containing protein [Pirellula sp.]